MYYIIADNGNDKPQVLGRYSTEEEAEYNVKFWRRKAGVRKVGEVGVIIVRTI